MSVTLRWLDSEQTKLLWVFHEPWTWEEVGEAWDKHRSMIMSVDHAVDMLVDARRLKFVPNNTLQMIQERFHAFPPNLITVTLIGAPIIVKAVIDVVRLRFPAMFMRVKFASSYNDACQLISSSRLSRRRWSDSRQENAC